MVKLMYEGEVQTAQKVWLWGLKKSYCSGYSNYLDEFCFFFNPVTTTGQTMFNSFNKPLFFKDMDYAFHLYLISFQIL